MYLLKFINISVFINVLINVFTNVFTKVFINNLYKRNIILVQRFKIKLQF